MCLVLLSRGEYVKSVFFHSRSEPYGCLLAFSFEQAWFTDVVVMPSDGNGSVESMTQLITAPTQRVDVMFVGSCSSVLKLVQAEIHLRVYIHKVATRECTSSGRFQI
jgi:hypothetical protein